MPQAARFVKLTVDGPRKSWMPLTRSRARPAVNGPSFAGTSLGSHMIVTPTPVGLILCDHVLVEQGTKKVSLWQLSGGGRGRVPSTSSAILRLRYTHRWS